VSTGAHTICGTLAKIPWPILLRETEVGVHGKDIDETARTGNTA
jgi:hypothetical protein